MEPTNQSKVVDLSGDGKLVKTIINEGDSSLGCPQKNSNVFVHYVGTLASDNTEFDSSRTRNQPFSFKLGKGSVIKGWDQGVATMHKGEKAILSCSHEYAYGKAGSPPKIPPEATLNFEIELLYWIDGEDVSGDGLVMKKVIVEGSGYKTPKDGEKVKLQIEVYREKDNSCILQENQIESELCRDDLLPKGVAMSVLKMKQNEHASVKCNKKYCSNWPLLPNDINDDEFLRFEVKLDSWIQKVNVNDWVTKLIHFEGEGYESPKAMACVKILYQELPDGLKEYKEFNLREGCFEMGIEDALEKMKKGEKATVIVKPSYRDNSETNNTLNVYIELIEFEKQKETWDLSSDEKIEQGKMRKAKATNFFNAGKYRLALYHYDAVAHLLDSKTESENESEASKYSKDLEMSCILNASLCQLKLKMYKESIVSSTKILKKDSHNIKALYRRAHAYYELDELVDAKRDLEEAQLIDNNDNAVTHLLQRVFKKEKIINEKDQKIFSKIFS